MSTPSTIKIASGSSKKLASAPILSGKPFRHPRFHSLPHTTSRRNARFNILSPIEHLVDFVGDMASGAEHIIENPIGTINAVIHGESPFTKPSSRPRTGQPFVDGLIGVESNPGPNGPTLPRRRIRNPSNGAHNAMRNVGKSGPIKNSIMAPVATGTTFQGTPMPRARSGKLFGDDCMFIVGSCMVQQISTTISGAPTFVDGAATASNYMYINPSVCCQNSNYSTPTLDCPIQLISVAYRKYQFTRLRARFNPVYGNAAASGALGLAYVSDLTVGSPSSGISTLLRYECSSVAPIWQAQVLDLTDFLDKSKWYTREINHASLNTTAYGILNSIQGTLICSSDITSSLSTVLGFVSFEFEIALMEIGPVQGSSGPSVSLADHLTERLKFSETPAINVDGEGSKDECKTSSTLGNLHCATTSENFVSSANTPLAYRFFQKIK